MAGNKTVVVGSTVSASQLKDLFRQIDDRSIGSLQLQAFLEHRNPWGAYDFEVISDGRNTEELILNLEQKCSVDDLVVGAVRKSGFVSTSGVAYRLVVIRGDALPEHVTNSQIRAEAAKLRYRTPPVEAALLLREKVSDETIASMGLSKLVVMHEPMVDTENCQILTDISEGWLSEVGGYPNSVFGGCREYGFVFLAPQE